jgi:sterol desaturase/sphingolipid hydroxylase (fatty acid hydroxylase superfamily)
MIEFNPQMIWRLAVFSSIFMIMAILEELIPHREAKHKRTKRWPGNILVLVVGNFLLRFLTPLLPFSVALWAESRQWMLSGMESVPFWIKILISFLILDLLIYVQHIILHKVPLLKNLHKMHHTDTHMDFTTALRFHPLEILFSSLYKSAAVALLGLPSLGVFIFEIVLNGSAMFNHGNIEISEKIDTILRMIIVTPDYHRIHHSRITSERNSNYGFFLTFWDRLFSTYTAEPQENRKIFALGIPGYNEPEIHRLDQLLLDPFRPLKKST